MVTTLTATDQDTAETDLRWSIPTNGGDDAGQFVLTEADVLSFTPAPDYETPGDADGDNVYAVTVQVSDGTNTDMATLEVTVENVIELATVVTGPVAVSYAENQAVRVATYTASSAEDRDGITWILSGDDKDHFSIDTPPGVLRFHIDPDADNSFPKLPDYEAPDDKDAKNDYEVIVLAQAGSAFTSPLRVTVMVTDENEAGAISLSPARPKAGSVLTATLTDPDGVTAGTAMWQWERSTGPNAWVVIAGAEAASYTPTAADTNAYLRVTATYDDEHGLFDHSVQKVASNVVTGPLLRTLQVTTDNATADATHAMKPASFDPETLHYAIGCNNSDTMQVTLRAPSTARVAVDGRVPSGNSTGDMTATVEVTPTSDVPISVTDRNGAHTVYHVHCLGAGFYRIEAGRYAGVEGVFEGLLFFHHAGRLVMMDNNGVPRLRKAQANARQRTWFFRVDPDGVYRYAYAAHTTSNSPVVLNQHLEVIDEEVSTVFPLQYTDQHAFAILPNGNYLLISHEPTGRNLSHLTFTHTDGSSYGGEDLLDSAIQIITPERSALFTWKAWGKMPLEDCVQHRFARSPIPGYAHLNSIQKYGNQIVGSFRGCSKVLGIDATSGDVVWRVGRTNLSDDEWASRDIGPAPLIPVNDPEGEFCGQHSATLLPNGHLLLYDNGAVCLINPWTRQSVGTHGEYSRAVEYALDHDAGEAVFVRDHSLHGNKAALGYSSGQVVLMDNGDWLISWGRNLRGQPPLEETVTQVDPATGQEKFFIRFTAANTEERPSLMASPVPADALADTPGPLEASLPASAATSTFHTGSDTTQVVVAFSRPVKNFAAETPSLSVTGAEVTDVAPHLEAGAPANAYVLTLDPTGDEAVSVKLVADVNDDGVCTADEICTADGTPLTGVPETAHTIPGPVQVSFDEAAYTVTEGRTVEVVVELDRTHDRPGTLEIPLRVQSGGTDAGDTDYEVPTSVTFGRDERRKSVSVTANLDTIIEESETVELGFDLPSGVTPETTSTTRVTITDRTDSAELALTLPDTVAEDDGAAITARIDIDNGVTFSTEQTFTLTFSGAAERGSDYTVDADTLRLQEGRKSVTADIIEVVDDADAENAETIIVTAKHNGRQIGSQTVTILASDQPAETPHISIHAKQKTAGEDDGASFTVARTGDQAVRLTVAVRVSQSGNIPLMGSPPSEVTFKVGRGSVDLVVRTKDDRIVQDASERGVVTAQVLADTNDPPLYEPELPTTAEVTVEDDDKAAFGVFIASSTAIDPVTEGEPEPVQVSVTTDGVTFATDQTVTLTFGGTATRGTDYTVVSDTLTLTAGQTAVTTALTIIDDGAKEPRETVRIAVQHDGKLFGSATLTIEASEDTKPPTLEEAEVPRAGRSLRLTFSEPLDEAEWHRPAATAFTVTVAGEPHAVTTVTVSGAHVVLGLTNPVRPGQAVTVGYTMPTGRPAPPVLQDPAGNAVESFSDKPVENDSQFGRRPPPPRPPSGGGGGPACTEDLHGNTAAQATGIALATETAGAICPAGDVDYFTLTVPGRGLVFVDTTGVPTQGRIWQNEAVLATGPTGRGPGARLGARVQAGDVVVAVQGQGGATGEYAFVVTFSPGYLENPGDDSFQSGIGVISGWVCEAESVEIEIETAGGTVHRYEAGYGTERADTAVQPDGTPLCGDTDNGFGLLFNWNLLGDGEHTIVALVDEVELGRATVTVTTVGEGEEEEFLRDVAGACVVEDFPMLGEMVTLAWQETKQNFVITRGPRPAGTNMAGVAGEGYLENPGPNSFQSGIGVISGWVCEAELVEIEIETAQGDVHRYEAAYGTERADTARRKDGTPLCGDTDNGFGVLFNWNLLGEGEHTVVALVDGEALGWATVRVTTVGEGEEEEFLRGAEGECVVKDFPSPGETVTLEWQQNSQNFVVTNVE